MKMKKKTQGSSSKNEDDGDDAEAMEQHLSELGKEAKKNLDSDKVARLLSLTYSTHSTYMMSQTASTRTSAALQQ